MLQRRNVRKVVKIVNLFARSNTNIWIIFHTTDLSKIVNCQRHIEKCKDLVFQTKIKIKISLDSAFKQLKIPPPRPPSCREARDRQTHISIPGRVNLIRTHPPHMYHTPCPATRHPSTPHPNHTINLKLRGIESLSMYICW
jgi:hypothetical protein